MARASRILVRYLASSVLLVLVPLSVFSLFLFRYVSNLLVDAAISEANGRLEVLHTAVDREVSLVSDTAVKIGSSLRLRPFRVRDQPSNAYFAVQALSEFRQPTSVVTEIFLDFYEDDYLLCASTTLGLDRLSVIVTGSTDDDASALLDQLARPVLRSSTVGPYTARIFGRATDSYFLIRYPVPSWTPVPYATLTFALSATQLLELAPETDAGLQYAIVSPQGRAAATAGPVTAEFATRFHARHLPGSAERIEHEGGPLIVVDHLSPETGWAVYAFADLASITAPARTLQRVTALVIAAVAVVALGLILLAVRLNYHPVRSLLDVLSRAFGGETSIDTFDDARLTLSELIRHDRALERRLEREAGPAREGVVNQLIAGTPTTSLDLEAVWIGASPLPGAPRFVTLAIRATAASGGSGETVAALARMARACSEPPNARWLFRAGVFREPTAAVVQFTADPRVPDDQVARRLSCAALAAVRSARGVAGVNVGAVVGVGVVVESLDEVSVSYQEARRAYDQHFVLGVDRVIAPADVAQPRWDRAPVVLDPLALRQAVLSSRADEASQYLLGIGDELRRAGVPAYIARGLCVEVCRVVTDLLVELGDSPAADGEPGCARRVESYATFDAFARDVASVIARIGAYHRSRHDREAVRLVQLVRREIDEHLGDPQFSIQSLAEAHHLSPPALSNLFRRYAGTGANAYLTRRRIDAARALLRTTSLPLKDVAAQVGYQNVSSFIRRYRSLTGETPGDYRVRTAS